MHTSAINVTTIPAAVVPAGFIQITCNTRATKDPETGEKRTIPADQRSRSILIPEWHPNVSSKYVSLVSAALHETARAQLAEAWADNPSLRETSSALYTEDALLLWAARKAESSKLNGEAIRGWWAQSDFCKRVTAKYNPAQLARLLLELENLAAPVISAKFYNEEKALRRIASIGESERDAESDIGAKMILRLQRYVQAIRDAREAIGDVPELTD